MRTSRLIAMTAIIAAATFVVLAGAALTSPCPDQTAGCSKVERGGSDSGGG